jgi:hypothetical protein
MSYSLSRAPNRLSVVIPRRFSLFLCLFYPLWVGAWVTLAILDPAGKPESGFPLLMFGLVTVVFAYQWLWNLGGREELEFTPLTLTSRRILFGIHRTRAFEMARIADSHFVGYRSRGMSGGTPSGLGFSYDGKTIRLCDHVTQAEATALVSEIIEQFPQHAERWGRYVEGMPDSDKPVALDLKW